MSPKATKKYREEAARKLYELADSAPAEINQIYVDAVRASARRMDPNTKPPCFDPITDDIPE